MFRLSQSTANEYLIVPHRSVSNVKYFFKRKDKPPKGTNLEMHIWLQSQVSFYYLNKTDFVVPSIFLVAMQKHEAVEQVKTPARHH